MLLVATVGLLAGIAVAVVLGPDNRVTTGPHPLGTDQRAVVSRPEVLGWVGPTVTITAEVPGARPVFLGLANTVDVADFFAGTGYERVDSLSLPWQVSTTTVRGQQNIPATPLAADWWLAASAGRGGAQITVSLPEQTASLAVVGLAGDLRGLQISGSYVVPGGFGTGLGVAVLAVGAGTVGWLLRRPAPPAEVLPADDPAGDPDEERVADRVADRVELPFGRPVEPGTPR